MIFEDRVSAGKKLAQKLKEYRGKDAIVFALPRGGVVTGAEIAKELDLPLEILIVRKIGHPYNPEYAIGAVNERGHIINKDIDVSGIDPIWLSEEIKRAKALIADRRRKYLHERAPLSSKNKIAIIVDDGIATGSTMLAAIRAIKEQKPKKIVVAVPVSPKDTADMIEYDADEFVSLFIPDNFIGAVGEYYEKFDQVEDRDVVKILKEGQR